jgi:hypothetical protein
VLIDGQVVMAGDVNPYRITQLVEQELRAS